MTREEIKKEIEKIEDRRFYRNMKDRWTTTDRQNDMNDYNKLKELKEALDK